MTDVRKVSQSNRSHEPETRLQVRFNGSGLQAPKIGYDIPFADGFDVAASVYHALSIGEQFVGPFQ
jgi:hypothetical protein